MCMPWKKKDKAEGELLTREDWGFISSDDWSLFWATHPEEIRNHVAILDNLKSGKKTLLYEIFKEEIVGAISQHDLPDFWLPFVEAHLPE